MHNIYIYIYINDNKDSQTRNSFYTDPAKEE
jgi:hypothetical protein